MSKKIIIIGSGFLGCVLGGYFALKKGSARVAFMQLSISGLCCLLSFFMQNFSTWILLFFLVIWGISVVGDSPQFSTLVAQTAPKEYIGTALTITNSIGFAITILSIQLMGYLISNFPPVHLMTILGLGPLFGLLSMKRLLNNN